MSQPEPSAQDAQVVIATGLWSFDQLLSKAWIDFDDKAHFAHLQNFGSS
ncbi:hypothetical protein AO385_1608 [Moraxella catarrhalis]|uniref:Uncharacterized protein n=1 Tax=Moraxella catarrhalis TaxID=480 RepID=A0A198UFK9_MORCA|nr:hypothetical protein AO384_1402 [Moraxella catarrhalis]OAU98408.1 hypothetical protein AO385_1608 [Moraxella catarrhalis]OAU99787.1 hypothetical protein AO383_0010 [Moraxella catarrhalis]